MEKNAGEYTFQPNPHKKAPRRRASPSPLKRERLVEPKPQLPKTAYKSARDRSQPASLRGGVNKQLDKAAPANIRVNTGEHD